MITCYHKQNKPTLKGLQSLPVSPDLNCNLKTAEENGHFFYLPFIIYIHLLSFHFLHWLSIDVFIIFIDSNELFICRGIQLSSSHLLKVFSIRLSFLDMYFAIIFSHHQVAKFINLFLSVMANTGCQLNYIWNQQKPKLLAAPVRDILHRTIWRRKTHPKSEAHFMVSTCTEEGSCF